MTYMALSWVYRCHESLNATNVVLAFLTCEVQNVTNLLKHHLKM